MKLKYKDFDIEIKNEEYNEHRDKACLTIDFFKHGAEYVKGLVVYTPEYYDEDDICKAIEEKLAEPVVTSFFSISNLGIESVEQYQALDQILLNGGDLSIKEEFDTLWEHKEYIHALLYDKNNQIIQLLNKHGDKFQAQGNKEHAQDIADFLGGELKETESGAYIVTT